MIKLDRLTRNFGELTAVDHVSFEIPEGQIFGYLGPNGAGKTTTVKMLTGLLKPTEGAAFVSGFDVVSQSIEVKRRIGYVPESGALYQSLTPSEYLTFTAKLYGMAGDEIVERIEEIGRFFKLQDRLHDRMNEFSKGMRQKVVIASALLHNPDVIVMDEPLSGLDANTALMLKELLRNMANEGKTVFYCSHILEVVENLCDRVVIINGGRIIADGSVSELKEMNKKRSLEGVFNQLTADEDLGELVKAFTRKFSSGRKI